MQNSSSQLIPMVLNLVAAVVGALGQYAYKIGAKQLGQTPVYRNWPLFLGMVLFCVVMALFVWAFKLGGRMSVVYPIYATTFLWGTAIAILWDKEPYSILQIWGVVVIVAGVSLVAIGATR